MGCPGGARDGGKALAAGATKCRAGRINGRQGRRGRLSPREIKTQARRGRAWRESGAGVRGCRQGRAPRERRATAANRSTPRHWVHTNYKEHVNEMLQNGARARPRVRLGG